MKKISRRSLIHKGCSLAVVSLSLPYLLSCTPEEIQSISNSQDEDNTTYDGNWVSGGTELITQDFPDTGIFENAAMCSIALNTQATLGPCYFEDSTGEDISEGKTGLPMQLCLRFINSSCTPLADLEIEVWHCDTEGIYSGDTSQSSDSSSFAGSFCTANNSAALQSSWFRGKLTTNSDGRVNFKTCFPSWYNGRTIHIHFAVIKNNQRVFVSQFCFSDNLTEQICTTHKLYSHRGIQDTPLSSGKDTVFPSSSYDQFKMTIEENKDGTLLAYHSVIIS